MLERDIQKACLELLSLRGIFAWRNNTTGVYDPGAGRFRTFTGLKGVSDILGILPDGRFLAVEVKQPGKKPTPEQDGFLDRIAENGGFATWVTSVDELNDDLDLALKSP